MDALEYFVPGRQPSDAGAASRVRWPVPSGVIEAYVRAHTHPGDTVVLPYCQSASEVQEVLACGRRVVAAHFDAVVALALRAGLEPVPLRELDAAVARLGDSPKHGQPLRGALMDLYTTTCPACQRPAVADYFVWDRDEGTPVAKQLRCPACLWDAQTAVDAEDRERLGAVPLRGMHYHYVLDRVATQGDDALFRSRLEGLLQLYSRRNLYALAELTLKSEGLFPSGRVSRALKLLLLDCLDRCSSLSVAGAPGARRRGLVPPVRFLERNVWAALEEAAACYPEWVCDGADALAESPEGFAADPESPGYAGPGQVRALQAALPPGSVRLALVSPPPIDPAAWALSAMWGGWLLGAEAMAPVRGLLRQRSPDSGWYAEAMKGALGILAGLLKGGGRLVVLLSEQRPAMLQAVLAAAVSTRLEPVGLVQCGDDSRLEFVPTSLPRTALGPRHTLRPAEEAMRRAALAGAVEAIRARGEPVPWRTLHAAMLRRLAAEGLLGRAVDAGEKAPDLVAWMGERVTAALDDPAVVCLAATEGEDLWWQPDAGGLAPALCDRVEAAASDLLQAQAGWTEAEFERAVYERFAGDLTPAPELVALCLRAVGEEAPEGRWQLRAEDRPEARAVEQAAMVEGLLTLGRRLGFRAAPRRPFDVAWSRGGQVALGFAVRCLAALGEVLPFAGQTPGVRPYLVIPGGRSALVTYKLAHNPVWQRQVDEAGWRFLKYRHVREMLSRPDVGEYSLQLLAGLDPIAERESGQLPLF